MRISRLECSTVMLAILWMGAATLACAADAPIRAPGTYNRSLMHARFKRDYIVFVPEAGARKAAPPAIGGVAPSAIRCRQRTKSLPLVIALHGGTGTAKGMARLTGFDRLAEKEGFVVIYPYGLERHWNDGRANVRYRAHTENIDDVGFISRLIDWAVRDLNVDKRRVYVTGISNGGLMALRLAREAPRKLAAVAVVAASDLASLAGERHKGAPVSILLMSGTSDPLMPFKGGNIGFGRRNLGNVQSIEDTVKYWVDHDGCDPKPVTTELPDADPKDKTRVVEDVYRNAATGAEVVLYRIEDGGHTWPGGPQYLPERIVGRTSQDIDAAVVIWRFFQKHVRK